MVAQPHAAVGDHTHCPVSGALFEVNASSPRRIVDGKTLFFCCEACANYFSANSEHVLAVRGLGEPQES